MSDPETTAQSARRHSVWSRVLAFAGSFRLAIVVISLSIILVFVGTLAQRYDGLYIGQTRWFKSWLVYYEGTRIPIFPGGYTLGTLFLINMLCGHLRRFTRPPGGLPRMLLHYGLLLFVLWISTHYLLLPAVLIFVAVFFGILALEMTLDKAARLPTGVKLGVDFAHIGIAMLLIGQLATDMMARESFLSLQEGETKSYSEAHFDFELAFTTDAGEGKERTVAIPSEMLKAGATFSPPELPFKVTINSWQVNTMLVDRRKAQELEGKLRQAFATVDATYSDAAELDVLAESDKEQAMRSHIWEEALKQAGISPVDDITGGARKAMEDKGKAAAVAAYLRKGLKDGMIQMWSDPPPMMKERSAMRFAAMRVKADQPITDSSPPVLAPGRVGDAYFTEELPEDRTMDGRNMPGAVVSLDGTAKAAGSWLVHPGLLRQAFDYGGKTWHLELRPLRSYHPLSVTLLGVTHDKYEGTDIPKDFRSRVKLQMPGANGSKPEEREVEIYMNYPLRLKDQQLTMFQAQMDKASGSTGLQVVKNPSWFVPYFGCVVVAYGLIRHFLLHLVRFMNRSALRT